MKIIINHFVDCMMLLCYSNFRLNHSFGSSKLLALWQGLAGAGMAIYSLVWLVLMFLYRISGCVFLARNIFSIAAAISILPFFGLILIASPSKTIFQMEENRIPIKYWIIIIEIIFIITHPIALVTSKDMFRL